MKKFDELDQDVVKALKQELVPMLYSIYPNARNRSDLLECLSADYRLYQEYNGREDELPSDWNERNSRVTSFMIDSRHNYNDMLVFVKGFFGEQDEGSTPRSD